MKYSWFTTMLVILEIKVSLVSFKKSLYHYNPPYIREVSSHRVLYLKFLSSFYICIIYLHLIEACLEVTIAIFYFCHSKNSSDVMKNIFNSWKKIYILEKNFFVNKYKKQRCYKENKSFFLTSWKMTIFFLEKFVIFNCHFVTLIIKIPF